MIITDPGMKDKVDRVLRDCGGLYEFEDIVRLIYAGKMQSFTVNDTWIVTQVLEFPRRKVLEIAFVVGFLDEAIKALPQLEQYAHAIGATMMTALAREGWGRYREPGWRKTASFFVKEL